MPAAVAAAAAGSLFSAGFVSTAIFVANYGAAILTIGGLVVQSALSSSMANRAKQAAEDSARASYNASLRDITMIVDNPIVPRNIVLGEARTSGPLWPWFTSGPVGENHTFAVVLAGHECDSIPVVFFGEDAVTLDGVGRVIGPDKYVKYSTNTGNDVATGGLPGVTIVITQVPSSAFNVVANRAGGYRDDGKGPTSFTVVNYTVAGNVVTILEDTSGYTVFCSYSYTTVTSFFTVRKHLGGPGQVAAPELVNAAAASGNPAAWDASRVGTGICYLTVEMFADFNTLGDIGVPKVSAVVRGVKAYDPRTGVTAWTQNPALLARWFLVDCPYSPKTLASEIDNAECIASANVCDEAVNFSAARVERRYTANGLLSCEEIPLANLNNILDAMDGDALPISGMWQLVAGYYKVPTLTLDEDTLSDASITIAPYTQKSDLFNAITGTFYSPAFNYQQVSYDLVTNAGYQAEDGGEVLPQDMNFVLINDAIRCQMVAWQRLSRARNGMTVQLGTNMKGYDTSPLKNVNVHMAELIGPDPKVFSVRRRDFAAPRLTYTLQETGPEVWAWDYTRANAAVDIPNTSFPDVLTVPVLQNIVVDSGTASLLRQADGSVISRIKVSWDVVQNIYIQNGGRIRWQYRKLGDSAWTSAALAAGTDTSIFLFPVEDGVAYQLRGQCISSSSREGNWCPTVVEIVIGKTEPPPDIIDLSISGAILNWSPVDVPDLKGYIFRFQYGSNFDWGSAVPMHSGLIISSPFDLVTRPNGVVTIMGKAVDTTGNQSVSAGVIVTDLGDPVIANVVETFDFGAANFPGALTGGALAAGTLQATSTSSAYGTDDQSFYGLDNDPAYGLSAYAQMVYITKEVYVSKVLAGSIMTLLIQYQGTDLVIEYRLAGPGSAYGADGDSAYGPDADPFYDGPGSWIPWPGQIVAVNDVYQLRVTIGAGNTQGLLSGLSMVIDAPDIVEYLNDVVINAAGTVPAYTEPFTVIKTVTPTLQANASGAETIETNKTANLAPVLKAYNAAHVAVSGATADIILKGY